MKRVGSKSVGLRIEKEQACKTKFYSYPRNSCVMNCRIKSGELI